MSSANEKLRDAAGRGDVAEIERLVAAGADPNAFEGTYRITPLQQAAINGHVAAIAALLKAGARVDGADSAGSTPLMHGAANGHTVAVATLLGAGADVHRAHNSGDTALHWASMNGHLDAARALLEAGAKTDVRNKKGKRPMDEICTVYGANMSNAAALRALLERPPPVKPRAPVAAPAAAGGAGARSPAVAAPAAAGGLLGGLFAPAPTPTFDAAAVARERDSLAATVTLATLQAEVAKLRGEVATRDVTIAARDRDAKAAAAALAAINTERDRLSTALAASNAERDRQSAALAVERDDLAAALASVTADRDATRKVMADWDATIAARDRNAKAVAAASNAERDRLSVALASARLERDAARKAVAERDASIAAHMATVAALDRDAKAAAAALSASNAERDAARKAVADRDATIAARDSTIAGHVAIITGHVATIAGLHRELDAARSGAAGGAGAAAAPAKPSLVDCELAESAVTFTRTRKGDRIRIGKGSFGDVYAATFGDQPCVVKVPHVDGEPATVPAVVQVAFWAEVRTQFAFRHPHIVALHGGYADVDPAAGGVVEVGAVMERCSGGTLEGRLHGGEGGVGAAPGPLKQRLAWGAQVLSALAYLHAKDFIHADLKPENVLLEDGSPGTRAKLSDFGLSVKRRDGSATRESLLGFRGSLAYVDCRVLAGGAGSAGDSGSIRKPSDVYSAGVMLWELATVRRPYDKLAFPPETAGSELLQTRFFCEHVAAGGRPATPADLAGLAPSGLGALIGCMWATRAEDRPTAAAAGEELARLAAGLGDA